MKKCVYVIIDGVAGSAGKGKVIGEFALEKKPVVAISNNMPNAGHTFEHNNKKYVFRSIPVSAVNKNTKLFIGPNSIINMEVLEEELQRNKEFLDGREIIVHPCVPLIDKRHIEWEKKHIKSGSTFEGCSACLREKIARDPELKYFKNYKNMIVSRERYYEELWHHQMRGDKILLEGAQGCDLDLNHSGNDPYTTSRQISVDQMFADCGISSIFRKSVIMVIRPFPIRISNKIYDGSKIYSGDYGSGQELSWMQINVGALFGQYPTTITQEDINTWYWKALEFDYTEFTTVTKQKRRVFELDIEQLKHNVRINQPDKLYLNFFEHFNYEYEELKGNVQDIYIDRNQEEFINWLECETGVHVWRLGTGADLRDYIDMDNHYSQRLVRKRY